MPDNVTSKFLVVFFLLLLSAFLSGSEAALFSLHQNRLREFASKRKKFKNIFRILLEKPVDIIILIVLSNEVINITVSALMASFIISALGDEWKVLSIAIMLPLLLIFGDMIPKVIAMNSAERISQIIAIPLEFTYRLMFPFIVFFRKAMNYIATLFPQASSRGDIQPIEGAEEVRAYLEIGEESGVLDPLEKQLIENVFSINEILVSKIMRPRREIFYIPHDIPDNMLLDEIKKRKFAKIPVIKNGLDDMAGILHVKDLLIVQKKGNIHNWHDILRKPVFVFKNKNVASLLKDMRERNYTICFVIDEYGHVLGLLTITDILKIIFKEFENSRTFPGWMSEKLEDGSYLVSPQMLVELFNEFFNAGIPTSKNLTMGRFLKNQIGRRPKIGDKLEMDKWVISVEEIQDKKFSMLRVRGKENE